MHYLIGDIKSFAIEVELSNDKWCNRTALWLNNNKIGDWEDTIPMFPFVNSLHRIANQHNDLWLDELTDLEGYQLYLTIHPCYNDPESFYDLPDEEQEELERFDKFLLSWGENFDSWGLSVVCKEDTCKFLWVYVPKRDDEPYEVRNNIQCFKVSIEAVQQAYNELISIVQPFEDEFWYNTSSLP